METTSSIHARIQTFMQQHDAPLALHQSPDDGETIVKAGLIPFRLIGGSYEFYVMKPVAKHPHLAPPPFQLCKGTRQHFSEFAGWLDISEAEQPIRKETLLQTAMREAEEEIGITIENVDYLFDVGVYGFASANTGVQKQMWLFAASLRSQEDVLPASEIATTTAQRRWMSADTFDLEGRADHRYILHDIEKKLTRHFQE